jgi:hypothetical protein
LRRAYLLGFRRGYLRGLTKARAELDVELARATADWDGRLSELQDDYTELITRLQREEAVREAIIERATHPGALLN